MPSSIEFEELVNNCSSIWTTLNGVNGRLFTSNINGNVLFIPAAGGFDGTTLTQKGTDGLCWSSTYQSSQAALSLDLRSHVVHPHDTFFRRRGFNIRAVQDSEPDRSVDPPTPEE